ncbi:BCCT family transporter [Vibrio sp. SS-MA-C1-2]|uniref:BCCT family transporter n=1 Tax=Vibrio sp. SS-MA-C1-2 TaxID=2908646 RepID=UPI001F3A045B|nr:BCCT family transporter [Vibrio sp. SS-MA-C1-2]UJF17990.1 BCCT family transporter [Vibrio sp. SS-MA-C1-2]
MSLDLSQQLERNLIEKDHQVAQNQPRYNYLTIGLTLVVVSLISLYVSYFPEQGIAIAEAIFNFVSVKFATPILWWAIGLVVIAGYFIFSKYGHIRMGNEKPEYSTLSYISIMAFAGFGSGSVYWAFLEWGYYISTPPFNVEPHSQQAYEWAVTYTLHHWGVIGWAIYAVTAIPVMYFFYVKGVRSLKLADIVEAISPNPKVGRTLAKLTQFLYPIMLTLVLITVLALGVPVLSGAISVMFNLTDGIGLQLQIIAAVVMLLILSTILGLKNGMSRLSDLGTYSLAALLIYILLFGPTQFILDNTSSSIGLWLQNAISMSTFTDSIGSNGFPQNWTVYFWAYWGVYIPLMCIFITKVSKGRTLRNMLICTLGGGTAGVVGLFSVTGSLMMNAEREQLVNVIEMLNSGQGALAITQVIQQLPLSSLALTLFAIATFLLLITTLDGSAFTLACSSQNQLDQDGNPNVWLKVFWCVVIVLVPVSFMVAGASVKAIQSAVLLFILPIVALTSYMLYYTIKQIKADFGDYSEQEIISLGIKK